MNLDTNALEAAKNAFDHAMGLDTDDWHQPWEEIAPSKYRDVGVESAVSAYLAAALPEVTSKVEAFINQRPEYIQALKNTRSGDDMSDYSRWNGHAESRRQLAQVLGWTVPHNPGETTRPEVKP